ncbi:MAG: MBL fold metallo-hydrolase [Methanobrevibacter sp.]|uniref:MBL fold metallo-hydrolase n=1 Tax=Methanobrevibacter sp. TaxID=66852 RepID=UPI0026DF6414|nr:MBL fold metallo-hydrolase [Methanobrevibacter sp.]MDO5849351.1 MBL fold metallo-hydrolase [Methanobrevibacter sp.]
MRLVSIASGSSGNCTLIDTEETHILVDAGITRKRISEGLNEVGVSIDEIDGIVITHEHIDHIRALGVISRNDDIQIYATAGTMEGIKNRKDLGKINADYFNVIETGISFEIGDITVSPFETYHDTNEPCGYTFTQNDKKAAVMTDTGIYDGAIAEMLKDCNALLLESNHDIEMLRNGDYPEFLKRRILGNEGHMSNHLCAHLIEKILHDGVAGVVLGHLSKDNNTPEKALETVKQRINEYHEECDADDFDIFVAERHSVSRVIEF